jgi:methionyl aminopeptidase
MIFMTIKTPKEIEIMTEGGRRLGAVLRALETAVQKGVTTKALDRLAYSEIVATGAKPAFLNYRPAGAKEVYPYTLCASVNDVIVHGQPSNYALKEGDIISLDLGLIYKGYYLDAAVTVGVGTISKEAKKLLAATEQALASGITAARIGKTLGDVGFAIERVVSKNGFSVADNLVGHGIGKELHEDPAVFNFGKKGDGEEIVEGMVIAIEPMVCAGRGAVKIAKDDSFMTLDRSLAAHFEHTVAITKDGPKILTK